MRMLRTLVCGNKYEKAARAQGATRVAGVDEVGRGALFGLAVAALSFFRPIRAFAGCATQNNFCAKTVRGWLEERKAIDCH